MTRFASVAAGLLVLGLVAGVLAQDGGAPKVADIMKKAHKTKTGLRDQITVEVEKGTQDWPEIQKKTKELVTLASALGKNEPPMGEKASWKKLTGEYLEDAKALDQAAGKKDAKAVAAANAKLGKRCLGCHTNHRE